MRRNDLHLPHLVSTKRKRDRVVALDEQARAATKCRTKVGKLLTRRGTGRQNDGGRQHDGLEHAVQYNCGSS